jgi:hypothetical protein
MRAEQRHNARLGTTSLDEVDSCAIRCRLEPMCRVAAES